MGLNKLTAGLAAFAVAALPTLSSAQDVTPVAMVPNGDHSCELSLSPFEEYCIPGEMSHQDAIKNSAGGLILVMGPDFDKDIAAATAQVLSEDGLKTKVVMAGPDIEIEPNQIGAYYFSQDTKFRATSENMSKMTAALYNHALENGRIQLSMLDPN